MRSGSIAGRWRQRAPPGERPRSPIRASSRCPRADAVTRLVNIDRDALRDELEAGGFSGVVHIVGGDDEPSLTIELGLADRSAGIPNTARTRFAVASISKLMTGMTSARLVDRGALSWAARY